MYCEDHETAWVCNEDHWSYSSRDCTTWCKETFGEEFTSYGCDADALEPCQCQYDMIDGGMIDCEPGDVWCLDGNLASVCNDDRGSVTYVECNELARHLLHVGITRAVHQLWLFCWGTPSPLLPDDLPQRIAG